MKPEKSRINEDELYLTINEVARQIGVVPATIRNWEKQGLFVAKRTEKSYRIYNINDIEQLRNIKKYSKDKSMGINAIKMLYAARHDDDLVPQESLEAGEEVLVSKKFLGRKWKEYRLNRGYLLEDVARVIGISASYLSKIENVQANVSYDVLQKLARFYGENILYYISDAEEEKNLVKKNNGEKFSIGIEGITIESVISRRSNTLSAMIYTVEPGCGRSQEDSHNGEEFLHVLSGRIRMRLDGQDYFLQTGDSLSFNSRTPHSWVNHGKREARLIWVYTSLVRLNP